MEVLITKFSDTMLRDAMMRLGLDFYNKSEATETEEKKLAKEKEKSEQASEQIQENEGKLALMYGMGEDAENDINTYEKMIEEIKKARNENELEAAKTRRIEFEQPMNFF